MYKDFKKNESLDTGFVGGSGIMWMISGIVLGLMVGIGVYSFSTDKATLLSSNDSVQKQIEKIQSNKLMINASQNNAQTNKPLGQQQASTANSVTKGRGKTSATATKFSYYAVLPTVNVPVEFAKPIETREEYLTQNPVIKTAYKKQADTPNKSKDIVLEEQPKALRGGYLLRVASFRTKSRAQTTRGRLSKKGVNAYIQKKKVKGNYWYRVQVGPADKRNVYNWKKQAERLGHRPMVIAVK